MSVIEIKNLKKSFGDVRAVDDISFEVEEGSLFAFLGINGAGKSTTINIISTLLEKDSGTVIIDGHDIDKEPEKIREKIGIVFQNSVLDKCLSVRDNLKIRASYYRLFGAAWDARFKELCRTFDLEEIKDRPYGKLSGGQRRRVDIARALINNPKILILDEPTTGLDPQTRRAVWDIIQNIKKQTNMTVFLTTHYMEETASSDMVVIIDNGKIVAKDTPIGLKSKFSRDYVKLYLSRSKETDILLEKYDFVYEDNMYKITVRKSSEAIAFIKENESILTDFEIVKGDMDDVFLNITGKTLRG